MVKAKHQKVSHPPGVSGGVQSNNPALQRDIANLSEIVTQQQKEGNYYETAFNSITDTYQGLFDTPNEVATGSITSPTVTSNSPNPRNVLILIVAALAAYFLFWK